MATVLFRMILLTGLSFGVFVNSSFAHSSDGPSPIGKSVKASASGKTIQVIASDDMRFYFSQKPVLHDGDIISFEITNVGKVAHEFSIGDENEQKAHQEMMRKMPGMVHEDGNTITVKPGETKTLTWQFKLNHEPNVVFACNIPGHFEAGMYMKTKITSGK